MTYIVLDMDGVLLDSEPTHQRVIYEVSQPENISLGRDCIQTLTGMSAFPMRQKIKQNVQRVETVEELVQFHKDHFFQKLPELHVAPVPHVKEVLVQFRSERKYLPLVPSSGRKLIEVLVKQVDTKHYFKMIMSGDDVKYSKPNPEIFLKVVEWYALPPARFTAIEDNTNSIGAAKSVGTHCIDFQNPLSGGQNLQEADHIIHLMSELLTR